MVGSKPEEPDKVDVDEETELADVLSDDPVVKNQRVDEVEAESVLE